MPKGWGFLSGGSQVALEGGRSAWGIGGGQKEDPVTANQQPGLFDHLGAGWGAEPPPAARATPGPKPLAKAPTPKEAGKAPLPLPWAEVVAKAPKVAGASPPAPGGQAESPAPALPPLALEAHGRVEGSPGPASQPDAPPSPGPLNLGTLAEVGAVLAQAEGAVQVSLLLDGRPHRLGLGPDGLRLWRGEELVGESGWAALGAHLSHQRARMATLIGARRVPASLLAHPDFASGILPHLYVNAYHGDRLARGALRRRVEVRASDLATVERLMAVEVACANPDCLHAIHPFRPRAKGNPLRLFVGFTCPLEESVACARTRGAKEAMEALVLRVEALGQVAGNDVRR